MMFVYMKLESATNITDLNMPIDDSTYELRQSYISTTHRLVKLI
jgi:hypothetical protein